MGNETIDKQKLFDKLGYKPHKYQQMIHDSDATYLVPCCGRRFGKSIIAGHEITWRAMQPDQYIWIVGPTYRLGEKEYRVVYDDFKRKLNIPKIRASNNVKQGDMRIDLPWNTTIEVVSAEKPDGLVGEGLNFVCMSEAALHSQQTWDMYVQPALSDKRGGGIFPSTPRGHNWYKGAYQLGQDPDNTEWASWRFPTWYNEIMYPLGLEEPRLKEIRASVSEHYWDQEYGADFTSREGRIYKDWNDTTHVISGYKYNPAWSNWIGIDPGVAAPFAAYDIQIDDQENVYVWREYQVRHKSTWENAHALLQREQPAGYTVHAVAVDPRMADAIATMQLIFRWPILANPVGQEAGHEFITRWLKPQPITKKPKLFVSNQCPILIKQMENLEFETIIQGKNEREGQKKYDDHGPDAVRYFFNEWGVLGNRYTLEDVYGKGGNQITEAEGFFTANAPITMSGAGNYSNFGY